MLFSTSDDHDAALRNPLLRFYASKPHANKSTNSDDEVMISPVQGLQGQEQ